MAMWWLLTATAMAGYGDAQDGFPTLGERAMHLWTNAVRVATDEFEDEYQSAGCSYEGFTADEQTLKPPLRYNTNLNVSSRAHTTDMVENNFFDHTGSDGSAPWERAQDAGYGSSSVGENIAQGYGSEYVAVTEGWMCSDGHRANIMAGSWDELGTGSVSGYYTQNFGQRGVSAREVTMAHHNPSSPTESATFFADYYDPYGDAPAQLDVVINGELFAMELVNGAVDMGIYRAQVDVAELDPDGTAECFEYYVRAVTAKGDDVRFPESGSYGWWNCAWDDEDAKWLDRQLEPGGQGNTSEELLRDIALVGCSAAGLGGSPGALAALFAGLLAVGRRRR